MFIRKKPSLLFRRPVHDYTIVTAQCFTGTLPGGIMPVLVLQTDGRTARFSYLQCFLRRLSDQLLLDRMTYVPYKCPVFNQWPLCSVSLRSAPAGSCKRPCSGPMDAQRLSRPYESRLQRVCFPFHRGSPTRTSRNLHTGRHHKPATCKK